LPPHSKKILVAQTFVAQTLAVLILAARILVSQIFATPRQKFFSNFS